MFDLVLNTPLCKHNFTFNIFFEENSLWKVDEIFEGFT